MLGLAQRTALGQFHFVALLGLVFLIVGVKLGAAAKDLADPMKKDSQVAVGDGVLPIPAIFQYLLKTGYKGGAMLEYEINADNPLPGMVKSFAYMRGVIAGLKA